MAKTEQKTYIITYKNGKTLETKAYDISKEENGWTIWNGLKGGVTFLSDEHIEMIEVKR